MSDPTPEWQHENEEAAAIAVFAAPPKITKATQPTISVIQWRCSVCGKWSHAKRRPRHHEKASWEEPDAGVTITRAEEGQDEDGGRVTFWWVACGPFEKWEAWKVEEKP